jgi:hypothetical protein
MATVATNEDTAIIGLMATPENKLDVEWLRQALQHALVLELATIPPYSCGLWSIIDPQRDKNTHHTIREIIFDEMSHMALVGNMLTAIGGTPVLTGADVVPRYPGPLPGGVRPELQVRLAGLTRTALDMYSAIEEPDEPIVTYGTEETHTSIGAFYTKIKNVFRSLDPALITPRRQITFDLSCKHGKGNEIIPMKDLATVLGRLNIIMEQGEGTSTSPQNPHCLHAGELSHYYAFRELYHGRKLAKGTDGRWSFTGDTIPLPDTYAAAEVPAGGWPKHPGTDERDSEARKALQEFNREYSDMLRALQTAWGTDDTTKASALVAAAIKHMAAMRTVARKIMTYPLPDGSGWRYCPEFLFVSNSTTT